MATVTISAPLASTAARVSSKSRYLPVPTIRRERYSTPATVRGGSAGAPVPPRRPALGGGFMSGVLSFPRAARPGMAGTGRRLAKILAALVEDFTDKGSTAADGVGRSRTRSPSASTCSAWRPRGTTSSFTSTAKRLPVSASRSTSEGDRRAVRDRRAARRSARSASWKPWRRCRSGLPEREASRGRPDGGCRPVPRASDQATSGAGTDQPARPPGPGVDRNGKRNRIGPGDEAGVRFPAGVVQW